MPIRCWIISICSIPICRHFRFGSTDLLTVLREGELGATPEGLPELGPLPAQKVPLPIREAVTSADIGSLAKQAAEVVKASQARFAVAQLDLARLEAALPARRSFWEAFHSQGSTGSEYRSGLVSVERLNHRFEDTKQRIHSAR